jgi:hypothetical protein
VAVLDRDAGRRTFRRLEGDELVGLLAPPDATAGVDTGPEGGDADPPDEPAAG